MAYTADRRTGLYNWSKRAQARLVGRIIERHTGRVQMALEIGPGAGEMLPELRAIADQVHTQDLPGERMPRGNSGVHYAWALPDVAGGPWDLVYASHVLEHLPTHEVVVQSARNIGRVLKPGGYFVCQVPDLMRWGIDFYDVDATHGWPATPRRMRQLAEMAGLDVVYSTLVTGPVIGIGAYVLSTLWRLGVAKALLMFFPELSARLRRAGYTLNGDLLYVFRRPTGAS